MPKDQILDEVELATDGKVYNDRMLFFAAFFGGPLAAGYLMIGNYKTLGQQEKVSFAWLASIVGSIVYMLAIILFDYYIIALPGLVYSLICVFVLRLIFKNAQEKAVDDYLRAGGILHSGWRVTGIIVLAFMITAMVTFATAYTFYSIAEFEVEIDSPGMEGINILSPPPPIRPASTEGIASRVYGSLDHVITYDRAQISGNEIDELGAELTTMGFFDPSNQQQIYLEIENNAYVFFIVETPERANNQAVQQNYRALKENLSTFLETNAVSIILSDETWEQQFVSL